MKCCSICGKNVFELAKQGRYLKRISKPEEEYQGRCYPTCNSDNQQILKALKKELTHRQKE